MTDRDLLAEAREVLSRYRTSGVVDLGTWARAHLADLLDELEGLRDWQAATLRRLARLTDGDRMVRLLPDLPQDCDIAEAFDAVLDERDALRAEVDRVTALAEKWETATELGTGNPSIVMRAFAEELRKALAVSDAG